MSHHNKEKCESTCVLVNVQYLCYCLYTEPLNRTIKKDKKADNCTRKIDMENMRKLATV